MGRAARMTPKKAADPPCPVARGSDRQRYPMSLPHVAFMFKLALTAAIIFLSGLPGAAAIEPVFWRQRVFFVPYQPAAQDRTAAPIDKVQLLVSRDGIGDWRVLQEAQPHVRGFAYHAPLDGEYAFALRTSDRK